MPFLRLRRPRQSQCGDELVQRLLARDNRRTISQLFHEPGMVPNLQIGQVIEYVRRAAHLRTSPQTYWDLYPALLVDGDSATEIFRKDKKLLVVPIV